MKRIITITITYDLSNPQFADLLITPKNISKKITEKEMKEYFCDDEGFESLSVEVEDK